MTVTQHHACACCDKVCKVCIVADDQTDVGDDECVIDVRGLLVLNEWVCGKCLEDAKDVLASM